MRLNDVFFPEIEDEDMNYIPIVVDDGDQEDKPLAIPEHLPILPLRNAVLFTGTVIPITVGREKSIKLIRDVYNSTKLLGTTTQRDAKVDNPSSKDLHSIGTIAKIVKIIEMPDGGITIILQGLRRFNIIEFIQEEPYILAKIKERADFRPTASDEEYNNIIGSVRDAALHVLKLSPHLPQEASFAIKNIDSRSFLINFVASNLDIDNANEKQELLEEDNLKKRALKLLKLLNTQIDILKIKNDIQQKVHTEINQQQREYYLNNQLKTIQEELGIANTANEIRELREKAKNKKWPQEVADIFEKEIQKLERMNPNYGDYPMQFNYVQCLVDLPWLSYSTDNLELKNAEKILDEDHFGLEKVKERILEYLAIIKLKGDLKSPILCLYGPPGIGKTSLGKSVARALNRSYGRISLGGLHDEAEIRGHRRTYIGAMPGRIIQTIKKCGTSNPVIILDEIDKVGNDFRGDPAAALLEALDPEQNSAFHDNYLDVDYDLSKVMFITTANTIGNIHPALRDRMEMIDMSGYLIEEKIEIAKRYLLPKQLDIHGVKPAKLKLSDKLIETIIEDYTRESGVRNLEKQLTKVIRYIGKQIAFDENPKAVITEKELRKILGAPRFLKEMYQGNEFAGVVTGLAWTENGGEILFIETSLSQGKGNLTLTGNLGDVMKESATIALEYIKAHADKLNIPANAFENWNIHLHVPEGAIPKDGPSAGITMATAIASAFTQRKVRKNVAMTGEITLRGKVLPVGGIKEKILAAKRAGLTDIVLSRDNEKDIQEIKDIYIKGLTFHYVNTIYDVLDYALLNDKVKDAVKIGGVK
ncbi:MAG: endopeptidase La [Prevotellaceae bacterium]|jgi:ATP-dependent Lon protease|nr:endopeptidase La [Prevotellaceae bacterium]